MVLKKDEALKKLNEAAPKVQEFVNNGVESFIKYVSKELDNVMTNGIPELFLSQNKIIDVLMENKKFLTSTEQKNFLSLNRINNSTIFEKTLDAFRAEGYGIEYLDPQKISVKISVNNELKGGDNVVLSISTGEAIT